MTKENNGTMTEVQYREHVTEYVTEFWCNTKPTIMKMYWDQEYGNQYIHDCQIIDPKRDALIHIIRQRWNDGFERDKDSQYYTPG